MDTKRGQRLLLDKVDYHFGCWEWLGKKFPNKEYGIVRFEGKTHFVHRLSYAVFTGPIPDGMSVLHHCDNPICFRPSHLFLGTQKDNVRDCKQKGRFVIGERHKFSKLTKETVAEIKRILSTPRKRPYEDLGEQFGVSGMAIWQIERGVSWKSVPWPDQRFPAL